MTPYRKIYDRFLSIIEEDEWAYWSEEERDLDHNMLMEAAIPFFKFPRVSLERDENGFIEDLNNEEIQIIVNYMKCEWLNRCIMNWENIRPDYEERDFSPANILNALYSTLESQQKKSEKLESIYYRSVRHKPFKYSQLAEQ